MAALARSIAAAGHGVVMPDLWGTGDSEGEFRDASIERWKLNVTHVLDWYAKHGGQVRSVAALRFGALLAASWLDDNLSCAIDDVVCFQPPVSGAAVVAQNLRLADAAALTSGGARGGGAKETLVSGGCVNSGGYELTARMADEISALRMGTSHGARFHVFEIRGSGEGLTPGTARLYEALTHPGRCGVIHSAPFWMATEIVRTDLAPAFLPCIGAGSAAA